MTSNIGSEYILDVAGDDTKFEEMERLVLSALRSHFRPEFLNRIDDLILFHALSKKELRNIVTIQLKRIYRLLSDQKITLEMSEAAIDRVAESGYDPAYGARPLKRAIQRELENPIATLILENTFSEGSKLLVGVNKSEELTFNVEDVEIEATDSEVTDSETIDSEITDSEITDSEVSEETTQKKGVKPEKTETETETETETAKTGSKKNKGNKDKTPVAASES